VFDRSTVLSASGVAAVVGAIPSLQPGQASKASKAKQAEEANFAVLALISRLCVLGGRGMRDCTTTKRQGPSHSQACKHLSHESVPLANEESDGRRPQLGRVAIQPGRRHD